LIFDFCLLICSPEGQNRNQKSKTKPRSFGGKADMGTTGILGLLFEIDADPSKGQAALAKFEEATSVSLGKVNKDLAAVGGVAAGVGGALLAAGEHAAHFGEEISHTAERSGASVEQMLAKLENFPVVLDNMSLRLAKLTAYLTVIPTVGTSLLTLSDINKRLADNTKQMDQALTEALVKFQREALAARDNAAALKEAEHAIHGSGLADTIREWLVPAYHDAALAAQEFGNAVTDAGTRNVEAENAAIAAQSMRLVQTIAGRRAAAAVEAAWETAKGIACLADWDFRGAALHFMSAAEYGIIAGTGGGARAGAGAGGGPGTTAGGRPTGTTAPGQAINVYVEGVISPDNLQQVIAEINSQVQNMGTVLVSTTSLQPATVRGLR
jgi:hypothetical protein